MRALKLLVTATLLIQAHWMAAPLLAAPPAATPSKNGAANHTQVPATPVAQAAPKLDLPDWDTYDNTTDKTKKNYDVETPFAIAQRNDPALVKKQKLEHNFALVCQALDDLSRANLKNEDVLKKYGRFLQSTGWPLYRSLKNAPAAEKLPAVYAHEIRQHLDRALEFYSPRPLTLDILSLDTASYLDGVNGKDPDYPLVLPRILAALSHVEEVKNVDPKAEYKAETATAPQILKHYFSAPTSETAPKISSMSEHEENTLRIWAMRNFEDGKTEKDRALALIVRLVDQPMFDVVAGYAVRGGIYAEPFAGRRFDGCRRYSSQLAADLVNDEKSAWQSAADDRKALVRGIVDDLAKDKIRVPAASQAALLKAHAPWLDIIKTMAAKHDPFTRPSRLYLVPSPELIADQLVRLIQRGSLRLEEVREPLAKVLGRDNFELLTLVSKLGSLSNTDRDKLEGLVRAELMPLDSAKTLTPAQQLRHKLLLLVDSALGHAASSAHLPATALVPQREFQIKATETAHLSTYDDVFRYLGTVKKAALESKDAAPKLEIPKLDFTGMTPASAAHVKAILSAFLGKNGLGLKIFETKEGQKDYEPLRAAAEAVVKALPDPSAMSVASHPIPPFFHALPQNATKEELSQAIEKNKAAAFACLEFLDQPKLTREQLKKSRFERLWNFWEREGFDGKFNWVDGNDKSELTTSERKAIGRLVLASYAMVLKDGDKAVQSSVTSKKMPAGTKLSDCLSMEAALLLDVAEGRAGRPETFLSKALASLQVPGMSLPKGLDITKLPTMPPAEKAAAMKKFRQWLFDNYKGDGSTTDKTLGLLFTAADDIATADLVGAAKGAQAAERERSLDSARGKLWATYQGRKAAEHLAQARAVLAGLTPSQKNAFELLGTKSPLLQNLPSSVKVALAKMPEHYLSLLNKLGGKIPADKLIDAVASGDKATLFYSIDVNDQPSTPFLPEIATVIEKDNGLKPPHDIKGMEKLSSKQIDDMRSWLAERYAELRDKASRHEAYDPALKPALEHAMRALGESWYSLIAKQLADSGAPKELLTVNGLKKALGKVDPIDHERLMRLWQVMKLSDQGKKDFLGLLEELNNSDERRMSACAPPMRAGSAEAISRCLSILMDTYDTDFGQYLASLTMTDKALEEMIIRRMVASARAGKLKSDKWIDEQITALAKRFALVKLQTNGIPGFNGPLPEKKEERDAFLKAKEDALKKALVETTAQMRPEIDARLRREASLRFVDELCEAKEPTPERLAEIRGDHRAKELIGPLYRKEVEEGVADRIPRGTDAFDKEVERVLDAKLMGITLEDGPHKGKPDPKVDASSLDEVGYIGGLVQEQNANRVLRDNIYACVAKQEKSPMCAGAAQLEKDAEDLERKAQALYDNDGDEREVAELRAKAERIINGIELGCRLPKANIVLRSKAHWARVNKLNRARSEYEGQLRVWDREQNEMMQKIQVANAVAGMTKVLMSGPKDNELGGLEKQLKDLEKKMGEQGRDAIQPWVEMIRGRIADLKTVHKRAEKEVEALKGQIESFRAELKGKKEEARKRVQAEEKRLSREADAERSRIESGAQRVRFQTWAKICVDNLKASGVKLPEKIDEELLISGLKAYAAKREHAEMFFSGAETVGLGDKKVDWSHPVLDKYYQSLKDDFVSGKGPYKLKPEQFEELARDLKTKAEKERKAKEAKLAELVKAIGRYGLKWSGMQVDWSTAELWNVDTERKMKELKETLIALGDFGAYPSAQTNPWKEIKEQIQIQHNIEGNLPRFMLFSTAKGENGMPIPVDPRFQNKKVLLQVGGDFERREGEPIEEALRRQARRWEDHYDKPDDYKFVKFLNLKDVQREIRKLHETIDGKEPLVYLSDLKSAIKPPDNSQTNPAQVSASLEALKGVLSERTKFFDDAKAKLEDVITTIAEHGAQSDQVKEKLTALEKSLKEANEKAGKAGEMGGLMKEMEDGKKAVVDYASKLVHLNRLSAQEKLNEMNRQKVQEPGKKINTAIDVLAAISGNFSLDGNGEESAYMAAIQKQLWQRFIFQPEWQNHDKQVQKAVGSVNQFWKEILATEAVTMGLGKVAHVAQVGKWAKTAWYLEKASALATHFRTGMRVGLYGKTITEDAFGKPVVPFDQFLLQTRHTGKMFAAAGPIGEVLGWGLSYVPMPWWMAWVPEGLAGAGSMAGSSYLLDWQNGISPEKRNENALHMAPFGVPWDQYLAGLAGTRNFIRNYPWATRLSGFGTSFTINSLIQGGMMVHQFLTADQETKDALAKEGVTDVKSALLHGAVHMAAMNLAAAVGAAQRAHLESIKVNLTAKKNPMSLAQAEKLYGHEAVTMALQQFRLSDLMRMWKDSTRKPEPWETLTPEQKEQRRRQKEILEAVALTTGFRDAAELMKYLEPAPGSKGRFAGWYWRTTAGRQLIAQHVARMQEAARKDLMAMVTQGKDIDPPTPLGVPKPPRKAPIDQLLDHPLFSYTDAEGKRTIHIEALEHVPANLLNPNLPEHRHVIADAAQFYGLDPLDVLPYFQRIKARPGQSLAAVMKKLGAADSGSVRGLFATAEITPYSVRLLVRKQKLADLRQREAERMARAAASGGQYIPKSDSQLSKEADVFAKQRVRVAMGTMTLGEIKALLAEEKTGNPTHGRNITSVLDGIADYAGLSPAEFRQRFDTYYNTQAGRASGGVPPYGQSLREAVRRINPSWASPAPAP